MKTQTYSATIFIGGDIAKIKDECRNFCLRGLCVTVTPTEYIYTGGSECGAAIGMINYPRFPVESGAIRMTAKELARRLMSACYQRSCTVMFSDYTEYFENPEVRVAR